MPLMFCQYAIGNNSDNKFTVIIRVRCDVITRIGSRSTSLRLVFVKRIKGWKKGVSTPTEESHPEIVRDRKFRSVDSRDLHRVVNNWFSRFGGTVRVDCRIPVYSPRKHNALFRNSSRIDYSSGLCENIVYGFSRSKHYSAQTVRLLIQRFPRLRHRRTKVRVTF